MMPVLLSFELFGWPISLPTYGLLLAAAFLLALAVAIRLARRSGIDPAAVADLWIASLLAGVVGAKLLLYVIDFRYYVAHPSAILATLRSAGVFYGGLAAAVAVCLIMVRRRGLDGWAVGDAAAPAIALGQAVGRLGCFAAGCCYGRTCARPWAVVFTDPAAHEITGVPLGEPLHPVQLYLSAADLLLFLALLLVFRRRRFTGQVFLLYLVLYAALRGTLEIFRGDPRGSIVGMSTSQAISLLAGAAGVVLYILRSRSARRAAPESSHRGRRGGRRAPAEAP